MDFDSLQPTSADTDSLQELVSQLYSTQSRAILATLVRLLGDFDLAEESMQEAFLLAMKQWQLDSLPTNPTSWVISTARFKGIDLIRRNVRRDAIFEELARSAITDSNSLDDSHELIADDRLRMIFTCCHPVLPLESQLALTLREVCGLTTEQIANAFLTPVATIAQRIVRAKSKIREDRIAYEIPGPEELPHRMAAVLATVYLVFNEGYAASTGPTLTKHDLSAEAIRIGRLLNQLLPNPEVAGLLALMLYQESRRNARLDELGELVLLDQQDRSKWDQSMIGEGNYFTSIAIAFKQPGPYTLQAAIASHHANAVEPQNTNWGEITKLYDALLQLNPTPVIALNRAVAYAMRDGFEMGLQMLEQLDGDPTLEKYNMFHATKADFFRRLAMYPQAVQAYQRALDATQQATTKRFLQMRLEQVQQAIQ